MVKGSGFKGSGFRVRFKVQGSGLVQGSGFNASAREPEPTLNPEPLNRTLNLEP
jgi:hypothetical protein